MKGVSTIEEQSTKCPCFAIGHGGAGFHLVKTLSGSGISVYLTGREHGHGVSPVPRLDYAMVIDNSTNSDCLADQVICELDKCKNPCTRCTNVMERAKSVLKYYNCIKKNDVLGVCSHCIALGRKEPSCRECKDVAFRFRAWKRRFIQGIAEPGDSKLWLSKIDKVLQDITEPDPKRKQLYYEKDFYKIGIDKPRLGDLKTRKQDKTRYGDMGTTSTQGKDLRRTRSFNERDLFLLDDNLMNDEAKQQIVKKYVNKRDKVRYKDFHAASDDNLANGVNSDKRSFTAGKRLRDAQTIGTRPNDVKSISDRSENDSKKGKLTSKKADDELNDVEAKEGYDTKKRKLQRKQKKKHDYQESTSSDSESEVKKKKMMLSKPILKNKLKTSASKPIKSHVDLEAVKNRKLKRHHSLDKLLTSINKKDKKANKNFVYLFPAELKSKSKSEINIGHKDKKKSKSRLHAENKEGKSKKKKLALSDLDLSSEDNFTKDDKLLSDWKSKQKNKTKDSSTGLNNNDKKRPKDELDARHGKKLRSSKDKIALEKLLQGDRKDETGKQNKGDGDQRGRKKDRSKVNTEGEGDRTKKEKSGGKQGTKKGKGDSLTSKVGKGKGGGGDIGDVNQFNVAGKRKDSFPGRKKKIDSKILPKQSSIDISGIMKKNMRTKVSDSEDMSLSEKFDCEEKTDIVNEYVVGERITKIKPVPFDDKIIGPRPRLFTTVLDEDEGLTDFKEEQASVEPSSPDKEQEITEEQSGITHYALSDRQFIDMGWTMLPTEKIVRKINIYRMRPAQPEFDWFKHNEHKKTMYYDTGEKLAEFDEDGRARWYYRSGRLALDYYEAEEINAQQRFVIYGSGEPDERGRLQSASVMAMFDYLGNGVVFDHAGKVRLKYNQTEGIILDRSLGPVSHWKWHTLNDPPVLQQVMIDTQLAHKEKEILELGAKGENAPRRDNEEMLAIEFDNFIKEKSKKAAQIFKPYQIKMKALKINDYFSLKVLDQASVYLIYRDGTTNIKINIGMILDHKEIVDTDTADVGEVSNSIERFPARTMSLEAIQRSLARAQHVEAARISHERRLRQPVVMASVDRLTASISKPLKRPLRVASSEATCPCYSHKRNLCPNV